MSRSINAQPRPFDAVWRSGGDRQHDLLRDAGATRPRTSSSTSSVQRRGAGPHHDRRRTNKSEGTCWRVSGEAMLISGNPAKLIGTYQKTAPIAKHTSPGDI